MIGRTAAERERDAVWDALAQDKLEAARCERKRIEQLLLAEREVELATEPDEPEGNYDCGVEPDGSRTLGLTQ